MYIQVNTNIIKNTTQNIKESLNEYENNITNLKTTINNINTIWKGNDYNFFAKQMDKLTQELNQMQYSLETYCNFLIGYSNAYEKLDNYYENENINIE